MNLNINRQILHEGKIFAHVEGMGFSGFVPSPAQPVSMKPYLDWNGGRISLEEWQKVLAFFRAHSDNEVQVRLYHNPVTGEWRAWAFPQEYPSGMTTREVPDHPNTVEDMVQFCDPWIRMGSVHHHCAMTAFQSGTDKTDEETVPGLHITMGKLKDPKWDIHSRVCMRLPGKVEGEKLVYGPIQCFYEALLHQWFALPPAVDAFLPEAIKSMVVKELIVTPPPAAVYPPRWDANLIRREYARPNGATHHTRADNTGMFGGTPSGGSGGGAKSWDTITPQKMDLISGMVEVYHNGDGKFVCQTIETYGWQKLGFANLVAVEGILRSCGLLQINKYVWCLPQDKKVVEDTQHEIMITEAKAEETRLLMEASDYGHRHMD